MISRDSFILKLFVRPRSLHIKYMLVTSCYYDYNLLLFNIPHFTYDQKSYHLLFYGLGFFMRKWSLEKFPSKVRIAVQTPGSTEFKHVIVLYDFMWIWRIEALTGCKLYKKYCHSEMCMLCFIHFSLSKKEHRTFTIFTKLFQSIFNNFWR